MFVLGCERVVMLAEGSMHRVCAQCTGKKQTQQSWTARERTHYSSVWGGGGRQHCTFGRGALAVVLALSAV